MALKLFLKGIYQVIKIVFVQLNTTKYNIVYHYVIENGLVGISCKGIQECKMVFSQNKSKINITSRYVVIYRNMLGSYFAVLVNIK